ncbi:hypothetical protein QL285_074518 [Trifolium repens]|nr:hypothetical protein QL285_074518 [Trifolium repens]
MLHSAYAQCPPSHKGSTNRSRFSLMFSSISYEYTSKSQDTTLKTRSLSYHVSFLEAPVEYHPLVVPCHYDKYHPNHYILSKLPSLRKNFTPYQYP